MSADMETSDDEADCVEDHNDHDNHVEVEELSRPQFDPEVLMLRNIFQFIVVVLCLEEAVVTSNVGEDEVVFVSGAVSVIIKKSDDNAEQSRQTLSVEDNQEHLHLADCSSRLLQGFEGVGHVDGHGVHPHEEANEGVVGEVGEEDTKRCIKEAIFDER